MTDNEQLQELATWITEQIADGAELQLDSQVKIDALKDGKVIDHRGLLPVRVEQPVFTLIHGNEAEEENVGRS